MLWRMSEIAAVQITAVGTIVLAVGAIVTALFAFLAFRKQSVEVKTLLEERKAEAAERHREQAVRILLWEEHDSRSHKPGGEPIHVIFAHIRNASNHPIYDVTCYWFHDGKNAGPAFVLGHFMPGKEIEVEHEDPENIHPHAVVEFRDVNGTEWQAGPNGTFKETHLAVRVG
jgi:hypothetical protein